MLTHKQASSKPWYIHVFLMNFFSPVLLLICCVDLSWGCTGLAGNMGPNPQWMHRRKRKQMEPADVNGSSHWIQAKGIAHKFLRSGPVWIGPPFGAIFWNLNQGLRTWPNSRKLCGSNQQPLSQLSVQTPPSNLLNSELRKSPWNTCS